jgi:hypothetical protein
MYGRNMGTLSVMSATGATLWSETGDQGQSWHTATVSVGQASFKFVYERGSGWRGDAAISDITVNCGA